MAVAGCIGVDAEYGIAVTAHMPYPLKISILKSAAEIRINDLDDLDELDRHISTIEQATKKRNEVVHGQFCVDTANGELLFANEKARERVEAEIGPVSTVKIREDADFIYAAGMELMKFLVKVELLPELPPLRPRGHKSKAARKKRRSSQDISP
jgi:hypothetical protein